MSMNWAGLQRCLCFLGRESSSERRLQMWVEAWAGCASLSEKLTPSQHGRHCQQRTWLRARTHAPAAFCKRSAAATEGASSPLTACPWLWQLLSRASVAPAAHRPRQKTGIVSSRRSAHAITSPACLRCMSTIIDPASGVIKAAANAQRGEDSSSRM
ncbi:unnamed protein product [Boreogadus saida]